MTRGGEVVRGLFLQENNADCSYLTLEIAIFHSDVSEDQEGVPVWLDIEVIDIETCAPVPKKYIEIWCGKGFTLQVERCLCLWTVSSSTLLLSLLTTSS